MFGIKLFRQLQRFDWVLFFSLLTLFAFGISAIYSVELSRDATNFGLLQKHLVAFGIGMVLLFVAANANYVLLRSYGRLLYIVGLILMVAVLFFGRELNGTTGWFIVAGVSFQPVEFMKIALAVQLARYFGEHARRRFGWRELLGSGFLVLLPVLLTMMQPDLGSALLLVGMWGILLFFAGMSWVQGAVIGLSGVVVAISAWFLVFADYQKQRVLVFLNPDLDPLGDGYNITQAKIAIGSGQIFGRGLGFGSQSQLKFLPESQTDFIFSVIGEELGFLGVAILLLAAGILLWRILILVMQSRDSFTGFLATAIFALIFVQMSVNIGVNLGILPATGVGLPFVSYGGSSLLAYLFLIGVVQSIAVRIHPEDRQSTAWYTRAGTGNV